METSGLTLNRTLVLFHSACYELLIPSHFNLLFTCNDHYFCCFSLTVDDEFSPLTEALAHSSQYARFSIYYALLQSHPSASRAVDSAATMALYKSTGNSTLDAIAIVSGGASRELVLEWEILFALVIVFTILRTYARTRISGLRGLRWDDYLVWIAVVFYAALTVNGRHSPKPSIACPGTC